MQGSLTTITDPRSLPDCHVQKATGDLLAFGISLLAAGFRLRRAYGRLRANAPA
jgi:hypothetical protein